MVVRKVKLNLFLVMQGFINVDISVKKMIGYKYYSANLVNGNSYFSKYPIENVGSFENENDIKKYQPIYEDYIKSKDF